MCESCVDRIFSQGPAPCPIAGCGRTLRKARFKKQTFEDLKVEREVDIRRRIAKVYALISNPNFHINVRLTNPFLDSFNNREEQFEDLRAYNDYLEMVEDITFNLIERRDVAANEAKLNAYAKDNADSIAQNALVASTEHSSLEEREAAQREASRLSREVARREEEAEKREKELERRQALQQIAENGSTTISALDEQKVVLKQSGARRVAVEKARQVQAASDRKLASNMTSSGIPSNTITISNPTADSTFTVKGLKAPVKQVAEAPYDPFGGLIMDFKYYSLQSDYEHSWLDDTKTKPMYLAGGYDVHEYYARALLESNAGLCCYIADEKAQDITGSGDKALGTVGAAVAARQAGDIDMGDDNA
ncbi:TFIIH/NER complex subunit [Ptychographa xylographoides]|nr:TFIIH/NER complex subunit [Ptychographa xylographoides]